MKPDVNPLGSSLTSVEEALTMILSAMQPPEFTETVDLKNALNRVLAEPVFSNVNVPPADNSSMDGYALCLDDLRYSQVLPVSERIPAGVAPKDLQPATCARVFTGTEIPLGANCVVMQEQVKLDEQNNVIFPDGLKTGENIRLKGQDVKVGDFLISPQTLLDYRHLGVLASIGVSHVKVFKSVRVKLLATGDELIQPGQPLQPGQIYNSNRYLLEGFLSNFPVEIVGFESVADHYDATLAALSAAADEADLIITTGGVSVGEEDHVKPAVESLGRLSLWKLAMKPGKPLAFGHVKGRYLIALPGNPVSVFVALHIFLRPMLQLLSGQAVCSSKTQKGVAAFAMNTQGRQEYVRVKIQPQASHYLLEAFPNQNSGVLTSTLWADALAIIPPNTQVHPGDEVEFIEFLVR